MKRSMLVALLFLLLTILDSVLGLLYGYVQDDLFSASGWRGFVDIGWIFLWIVFAYRLIFEALIGLPLLWLFFRLAPFKNSPLRVALALSIIRPLFVSINTLLLSFSNYIGGPLTNENGHPTYVVYSIVLASFISPWVVYFLGGKRIYTYLLSPRLNCKAVAY